MPAGERRGGVAERRGVSVQLDERQRSVVRDTFRSTTVHRLDRVDFAVRQGVRVPRTVGLYALPPAIIDVIPEYRAYRYIVVGSQLIIVDPATLQIVAILPA